ncbi:hypothetical protein BC829DRAFT_390467 [Chytridium lagenaria]|nr:hypothetical protein BC829DRAFT_390467 [Chytridium lagenaria]
MMAVVLLCLPSFASQRLLHLAGTTFSRTNLPSQAFLVIFVTSLPFYLSSIPKLHLSQFFFNAYRI